MLTAVSLCIVLTTAIASLAYQYGYHLQWLVDALLIVEGGGIAVWGARWLLDDGARRMAGDLAPLTPDEHKRLTPKDRLELANAARQTILQGATALAVVLGATFTAGGLIYTARTLNTTQQAQITDRYATAVDQLGSTKVDVRLGGIYALERLAHDSPSDAPTIANVLAAYIRVHSNSGPAPRRHPSLKGESGASQDVGQYELQADVVAAVKVLRDPQFNGDAQGADLHGARLPGIILDIGGDLSGADLREAVIDTDADFSHANMEKASFDGLSPPVDQFTQADLQGAEFDEVNMPHADFRGADLRKVVMVKVKLTDTWMNNVKLQGAQLDRVDFRGADLGQADLRGVDLSKTTGLTRPQISEAITDSKTRFPPGLH